MELDVRRTKDGELVLFHSPRVDRQTDGLGDVADLTLAEIRQLRICSWFVLGRTCEPIPTLSEALRICAGKISLLIDLKTGSPDEVVKTLETHGMTASTMIYDNLDDMRDFRQLSPHLRLQAKVPKTVSGIEALRADVDPDSLEGNLNDWSPELSKAAHQAGMNVWIDVLGDQDCDANIIRAIGLGADAIQTNRPERVEMFVR